MIDRSLTHGAVAGLGGAALGSASGGDDTGWD